MRLRNAIAIASMLLLVPVGAALAGSHERGAKATLKINGTYRSGSSGEVGATGILNTSKDCTPSRKVTIYRKKGGDLKRLSSGTTFSTGRWEAKTGKGNDVKSGTYVAKVKADTGRHNAKCDGDTSSPTKLP